MAINANADLIGGGRLFEIPESDAGAAVNFLQRWASTGPWVLSAKTPKGFPTSTHHPGQEREAAAWVAEHHQRRENMYFSPNLPHHDLSKKASDKDIAAALGCHVDVDPSDGRPLAEERERILAAMLAHEPPLSVVLDSGGGYQGFYRLQEPTTDLRAVVAINKRLETKLGGDHCHDICRVMRLPGTVNFGDADKLAKGRVPALAHVVRVDWDRRYSLADLQAAANEWGPPPPRGEPPPKREASFIDTLPISDRMRDLIRGKDDPKHPYPTRSERHGRDGGDGRRRLHRGHDARGLSRSAIPDQRPCIGERQLYPAAT
jgi:hypothetical protein